MQLVIFRLFLDQIIKAVIHCILASNVRLNGLDMLQYLLFILPVILVKMVVVCPDLCLQHFQHFFAHIVLGVRSIDSLVQKMRQLIYLLDLI